MIQKHRNIDMRTFQLTATFLIGFIIYSAMADIPRVDLLSTDGMSKVLMNLVFYLRQRKRRSSDIYSHQRSETLLP